MTAAPFRFEGDALLVLDQRALPARETWLRCETPGAVADAIRELAVRGAPAIGLAAAYGLALALDGGERCGREAEVRVQEAARLLRSARPTAVNLGWALDQGLAAMDEAGREGANCREALVELADRLRGEQEAADRRIAAFGAERFEPGDRALTHCNTGSLATGGYGTAGGVIRSAWDDGRLEQAWVTETRPLLQGARLTAWELGRAGIPFRLVTDSGVGALLAGGQVDRVVVGADRIAANGDVANKVGTYPIAALAGRHDVPFYVAAPLSTFDPDCPDGSAIPIEERDGGEVLAHSVAPAGTAVVNPAFDVTPSELVTAFVTEAGLLEPPYSDSIRAALGRAGRGR